MSTTNTGRVRVYGAGGCGINIASKFINRPEQQGYATVHPSFIDTSRSNLKSSIDEKDMYILDNVDGSGKIRKENADEINNVVKQVLVQHKPLDMNLVVFSASGGSGSVFGPLMVGELLERDIPVVAVVVGSDESGITCQNTLNTLKSLESISKQKRKPVVMYYDHNQRGVKRSDIDSSLVSAIASLCVLCSKQNEELDSRDIANWLGFDRVSTISPQLSLLSIFGSNDKVTQVRSPVAIASLYVDADQETIEVIPDYHTCGYTNNHADGVENLHFIISVDEISDIARGIQKTLDGLNEIRDSRVSNASLVSDKDQVDDSGLIL